MIVVAIIALLAVSSIPIYTRLRVTANESAAIATLKSILAGEQMYYNTYGHFAGLDFIRQLNPPYVDPNLYYQEQYEGAYKQGYRFSAWGCARTESGSCSAWPYDDATGIGFLAIARPVTTGKTGKRSFCVTEQGVVRTHTDDWGGSCDQSGEPIQ
jgi:Tfp pilus assembly protein PilE